MAVRKTLLSKRGEMLASFSWDMIIISKDELGNIVVVSELLVLHE